MPISSNIQCKTTIDSGFINDVLNVVEDCKFTSSSTGAGPKGPTGPTGATIVGPTGLGIPGPTGAKQNAPTGPTGPDFVTPPLVRVTIFNTVVTSGTTTLFLDSPDFDLLDNWSNGVFQPKSAGIYTIAISLYVETMNYGTSYCEILKNGNEYLKFGFNQVELIILRTNPTATDTIFCNGTTDQVSVVVHASGVMTLSGSCTIF